MSKKVPGGGKAKEEDGAQAPMFDPSNFVVLESAEGDRFFVDRNCARLSRLCKAALQLEGAVTDTIEFSTRTVSFEPIAELPVHAQQKAAAAASSVSPVAQDGGDAGSALGLSPSLTYPLVQLHVLNTAQLQKAVTFMHYKYRYDAESEKKVSAVFSKGVPPSGAEGLEWASIAHVLQL